MASILEEVVSDLLRLRKQYPILRRNLFLNGRMDEKLGVRDLIWINATGREMDIDAWKDPRTRCFGMLMDGRARATGISQRGHEATLLLLINDHYEDVAMVMPHCNGGVRWSMLLHTAQDEPDAVLLKPEEVLVLSSRSLALLALEY